MAIDLVKHPLFADIGAAFAPMMPQITTKHARKADILARHGENASTLFLVLSGWVSLVRQTPDGKEAIVGLCAQGDVFGEAALFANASYPYTAQVVSDSVQLASIPAPLLRDVVQKRPDLSAHVMQILGDRIAKAQLKIEQMTTLSAAQRLGCFLLRLCHTHDGAHQIHMPVEKHLIASYLGMKPETLSRSFQQLGELGITVHGAEVSLKNVGALREFVCGSCGESGMCDTEEELTNATPATARK